MSEKTRCACEHFCIFCVKETLSDLVNLLFECQTDSLSLVLAFAAVRFR